MFYFANIATAAKMFHSGNIDELMEARADEGALEHQPEKVQSAFKMTGRSTKPRRRSNKTAARQGAPKQIRKTKAINKVLETTR